MEVAGHKLSSFADTPDYFCPEQPHFSVQGDWELNPSFPLNFSDPTAVPTSQHILEGFFPHCESSGVDGGGGGFPLPSQGVLRSEVANGYQDLGFFGSFLTTIGTEVCSGNNDVVPSLATNHFAANELSTDCWNPQLPYETASSSLSSEELAKNPDSPDGNLAVLPEAAGEVDPYNGASADVAEQALNSTVVESKDSFDVGAARLGDKDSAGYNKTVDFHRGKKGLPAKNLMAERRRRKKLNDRLYMLRSIVPKISKMDRTSILGDAIDYLKELLQRIRSVYAELQNPMLSYGRPKLSFEEEPQTSVAFPTEVDVQTSDGNAINISMLCEQRPGLLLSTMRALDGLGVDVQEADISFANGFRLNVCAEQLTKDQVRPEEIKAVLLHTAGYFNPGMLPC